MRDVPGCLVVSLVVSQHHSRVENLLAGQVITNQGQVELRLGEVEIGQNYVEMVKYQSMEIPFIQHPLE